MLGMNFGFAFVSVCGKGLLQSMLCFDAFSSLLFLKLTEIVN